MIAAVREGKLLTMEGDYDHIVNRGSLCVKGISVFATHASPQRLTKPQCARAAIIGKRSPGTMPSRAWRRRSGRHATKPGLRRRRSVDLISSVDRPSSERLEISPASSCPSPEHIQVELRPNASQDRTMLELLIVVVRGLTLMLRGHRDLVLEDVALRHQLAVMQRAQKRVPLQARDRLFWIALAHGWRNWRPALMFVQPDTVVRWHRD
jgi:hypothetical protein